MSIILQNLRSVTPGVVPSGLVPGQLCFNTVDEIMFVGDGSAYQTSFSGTQLPATPGEGWFSIPLSLPGLSEFFIQNPSLYSPAPLDGEVLVYSASVGKPIWQSSPGTPTAYTTTNIAVEGAPGVSTSAKISNALGVTPIEADSVIVSGTPGDTYQGFYQFISGNWTYAAGYADPTALEVPYNNTLSGLIATTVQAALDELASSKLGAAVNTPTIGQVLSWSASGPLWVNETDVYPTAAQVSYDNATSGIPATNVQDALTLAWQRAGDALQEANSAQDDATSAQDTANIALTNSNTALVNSVNAVNDAGAALNVANAALPRAGGTMTGDISFNNGQPVDAGTF
jgi:hypothetical protein